MIIEQANRRRKNIRKWMLLVITPIVLMVFIYGTKAVSMKIFSEATLSYFSIGDMTNAQKNSERQKFANWFEEWKAYYNNGTTLVALGAYKEATTDLEKALILVIEPTLQCDIRANLAIAWEGYGDSLITDKKFNEAQSSYDTSKMILAEADETCLDPNSNPDSSKSIKETEGRLNSKGEEVKPEKPEPTEQQQEVIQEQIDKNSKERTETESSDPSKTNGEFGGSGDSSQTPQPVDKPW